MKSAFARLGAATTAAILLAALCGGAAAAAEGDLGIKDMQVDGGVLDFVKEKNAVIVRNYATLTFGEVRIRARNMIYDYKGKNVYAEGDVEFDDPSGSSFYCDWLFFNTTDWHGKAENVRLKAESKDVKLTTIDFLDETPAGVSSVDSSGVAGMQSQIKRISVQASELRSVDKDHQEGLGVKLSASMFAKPHWSIDSGAAVFRRGQKVASWNNVLRIGKVPVFYFPYLIKDLKYDWPWVRVTAGHSEDFGMQVYTRVGLDLDPDPKAKFRLVNAFFDVDWREERGWGLGTEMDYQVGKGRSKGWLRTYYTREDISESVDVERAYNDNDSYVYSGYKNFKPDLYSGEDRWMIEWKHLQEFNDTWDLRMEAYAYSDRDFQEEYFENEYKLNKDPECGFDLRYQNDYVISEWVANKRINSFQTTSEYLPEWRLNVPGVKLGNLPLYVESETRVGWVNRRFDQLLDKYDQTTDNEFGKVEDGDDYGLFFRAHNETKIRAPIDLGPFVLTPYVGGRATYYGDHYGENGDGLGESETTSAFLWGADLSTRLYGVFGGGGWRHVLEPTLSFKGDEDAGADPDELLYIDDVDSYYESHVVTVGLHQRLQKRTGKDGYRDIATFDVNFRSYPNSDEADDWNYGHHTGEIEVNTALYPTTKLSLWANALLDNHDNEVNRLYVGADWRCRDIFRFYVQHSYYRGHYWRYPTTDASRQTTFAIRSKLWNNDSNYAVEYAFTFDHDDNESSFGGFSEQRITLFRDLDTFELGLSFVDDRKDDDRGIYLNLRPIGWAGINRTGVQDGASANLAYPSRYGGESKAEILGKDAAQPDKNAKSADEPLTPISGRPLSKE